MAEHITYCYPPVDGVRNGVLVTEICVTEGDAVRHAVTAVVRSIEFLRAVYCGPNATPMAVRPEHITTAAPLVVPGTAGSDLARPAAVASERGLIDVDYGSSKTVAIAMQRQIDAALRSVAELPWTHVAPPPDGGGGGGGRPSCAPFVLRVQLSKPTPRLFGLQQAADLLEEWELRFVKLRLPGGGGGRPGPPPTPPTPALSSGPLNAGAAPLNHALGLHPNTYVPNDKGKLRDVLHFVLTRAIEAIDTYIIDELRVVQQLTLSVAVSGGTNTQCVAASVVEPSTATPPAAAPPKDGGGLLSNLSSYWRSGGGRS